MARTSRRLWIGVLDGDSSRAGQVTDWTRIVGFPAGQTWRGDPRTHARENLPRREACQRCWSRCRSCRSLFPCTWRCGGLRRAPGAAERGVCRSVRSASWAGWPGPARGLSHTAVQPANVSFDNPARLAKTAAGGLAAASDLGGDAGSVQGLAVLVVAVAAPPERCVAWTRGGPSCRGSEESPRSAPPVR